MFGLRKSLDLPTAADALPGRDTPMPVPAEHYVNGHPLTPPYPDGFQTLVVGMGCFWGAEKAFWSIPGVWTTAVGYAGGITPNPTYEETCSGRTGHTEAVLVVFDPNVVTVDQLLKVFWEGHDPTQGMRQGNDVGSQYRSAVYAADAGQLEAIKASDDPVRGQPRVGRLRRHHHRDRRRRTLLLRRGLPPAVPGKEPQRLLRHGWHRRLLPGRPPGRLNAVAAAPG